MNLSLRPREGDGDLFVEMVETESESDPSPVLSGIGDIGRDCSGSTFALLALASASC